MASWWPWVYNKILYIMKPNIESKCVLGFFFKYDETSNVTISLFKKKHHSSLEHYQRSVFVFVAHFDAASVERSDDTALIRSRSHVRVCSTHSWMAIGGCDERRFANKLIPPAALQIIAIHPLAHACMKSVVHNIALRLAATCSPVEYIYHAIVYVLMLMCVDSTAHQRKLCHRLISHLCCRALTHARICSCMCHSILYTHIIINVN